MQPGNQRARIVEAAYRVLAERGYQAASIKEIARAAGVAPGLIHYYFAPKEELLLAVLREASECYTKEMASVSETVPSGRLAEAGLAVPRERVARQPEWYRLRYDLFALGLRHPAIRAGVAELLAGGRRGIAAIVRKTGRPRVEDGADPDSVAAVLLACFDGLALQRLVDPEFDLDGAYRVLVRMIDSLVLES